VRHLDIHQDDVGRQLSDLFDGLIAVARLSNDKDIWKSGKKIVDHLAKITMVISDQNPDPLHG
jgi:hypothetical protein